MSVKSTLNDRLNNYEIITESGCWIWMGALARGYGQIEEKGKNLRAHRANYVKYVKPIPKKLIVRHICDNRCCINPDHLTLGTQQDNMKDMVGRGRSLRGIKAKNSILTEKEVIDIYNSNDSNSMLGVKYGTDRSNIYRIKNGDNWGHITNG